MSEKVFTHVKHPFAPIYDENSKILILGSLPSVKSRENEFYYGHAQNRFWKVIAAVFGQNTPKTVEEKKKLLLSSNIALWDVIAECDISGSSDSSVKNAKVNDLSPIFDKCDIISIFANGTAAKKLYDKYQKDIYKKEIHLLPSTSPANAVWTFEKLLKAWNIINFR